MNGNNGFGPAALILALGVGIALMIFASSHSRGAEFVTAPVTAETSGPFQVVLTNLATKSHHPWAAKTWPDQNRCDAALGNANEFLSVVATNKLDTLPDLTGADRELVHAIVTVVLGAIQNTGKVPNFSVSCELKGEPT